MIQEQYLSFQGISPEGFLLSDNILHTFGDFKVPFEGNWYIVFWYKGPGDSTYLTHNAFFYGDTRSPQLHIISPTRLSQYFTESQISIQWSTINNKGFVKLELLKGNQLVSTISAKTSNDGSHHWNIPESIMGGKNYNIKITSLYDGSFDLSKDFEIYERQIFVYDPRSTDILEPHSEYLIEWFSRGIGPKVRIDLFLNSTFLNEITNETEDDFNYLWDVWQGQNLSNTTGTQYQIRIQDCFSEDYFGFSPKFTITSEKFLVISSPVPNSFYNTGQILNITWFTDSSAEYLTIQLLRNNISILQITQSARNTGFFEWQIPKSLKGGTTYQIYIKTTDGSVHVNSEEFTVLVPNYIFGYSIRFLLTGLFFTSIAIIFLKLNKFKSGSKKKVMMRY